MLRRIFLLFSVLVLGSCAYSIDGADQEVTLLTPGANNALCYMWIDGVKYKMRPPHTRTVVKSKEDMVVDCRAPGNRQRIVVIEPQIAESSFWNVSNGVLPGAAWDSLSGATFEYPEIVEVDFRYMEPSQQPLPDQNAPDIKQPEEYPLEEFMPGRMRLNSDRFAVKHKIRRRERGGGRDDGEILFEDGEEAGPVPTKGDLQAVIEAITEGSGPSGEAAAGLDEGGAVEAEENVQPLYPVE